MDVLYSNRPIRRPLTYESRDEAPSSARRSRGRAYRKRPDERYYSWGHAQPVVEDFPGSPDLFIEESMRSRRRDYSPVQSDYYLPRDRRSRRSAAAAQVIGEVSRHRHRPSEEIRKINEDNEIDSDESGYRVPFVGRPKPVDRTLTGLSFIEATDQGDALLDVLRSLQDSTSQPSGNLLPTQNERASDARTSEDNGTDSTHPTATKQNYIPENITQNNVYASEYKGSGIEDGLHTVQLSAHQDSTNDRNCLFRWIHIHEKVKMDFATFKKHVREISGLADEERRCLRRLLDRVPTRKSSGNSTKQHARHVIEPGIFEKEPILTGEEKALEADRGTARFWSLPYLYLDEYCGVQPTSENDTSRYMPTLLQTRFAPTKQARDMKQASCQVLERKELCFHVPQLWCLVLDMRLLVTYTLLDTSSIFQNQRISLTQISPRPAIDPFVWVSHGNNNRWKLPLCECKTWMSFLSHFWELWATDFKIYQQSRAVHGKPIEMSDWPGLYETGLQTGKLTLELQFRSQRSYDRGRHLKLTTARLDQLDPKTDPQAAGVVYRSGPSYLHLLESLVNSGRSKDTKPGNQALLDVLDRVNLFLSHKGNFSCLDVVKDGLKFRRCPLYSHRALQELVLQQQVRLNASTETSDTILREKTIHSRCLGILAATEALFQLFLPLELESTHASKYWGAVYRLIQPYSLFSGNELNEESLTTMTASLSQTLSVVSTLADHSTVLLDFLSMVSDQDRQLFNLPDALLKPWADLLMCLVSLDSSELDMRWRDYVAFYRQNIRSATAAIIKRLTRKELRTRSVVSPMDIGLLLNAQLLEDFTRDQDDVTRIYRNYAVQLEYQIDENPSPAEYERSLELVLEEIEALIVVFEKQSNAFSALLGDATTELSKESHQRGSYADRKKALVRNIFNTSDGVQDEIEMELLKLQETEWLQLQGFDLLDKITIIDKDGLGQAIIKQGCWQIDDRQDIFSGHSTSINAMKEENKRRTTAGEGRRELALYAFSLVTVLFLPISTVAGIFGINTADMRNLDQNQWLFWAVATPLSVVIIFGGLLWAGELGNAWRGFIARFKRRTSGRSRSRSRSRVRLFSRSRSRSRVVSQYSYSPRPRGRRVV